MPSKRAQSLACLILVQSLEEIQDLGESDVIQPVKELVLCQLCAGSARKAMPQRKRAS